ncbi:hypothetical protein PG990_004232 [Apiospora arundinis]
MRHKEYQIQQRYQRHEEHHPFSKNKFPDFQRYQDTFDYNRPAPDLENSDHAISSSSLYLNGQRRPATSIAAAENKQTTISSDQRTSGSRTEKLSPYNPYGTPAPSYVPNLAATTAGRSTPKILNEYSGSSKRTGITTEVGSEKPLGESSWDTLYGSNMPNATELETPTPNTTGVPLLDAFPFDSSDDSANVTSQAGINELYEQAYGTSVVPKPLWANNNTLDSRQTDPPQQRSSPDMTDRWAPPLYTMTIIRERALGEAIQHTLLHSRRRWHLIPCRFQTTAHVPEMTSQSHRFHPQDMFRLMVRSTTSANPLSTTLKGPSSWEAGGLGAREGHGLDTDSPDASQLSPALEWLMNN